MLRAFQKQLNCLAVDQDRNFENHVRARWGKALPKGLLAELKEFIRLLPVLERKIYVLYVRLPEDTKLKEVSSYFLTYMYRPDDFLPENDQYGLFGYMDDAYLAALFYELMIEEIDHRKEFRLKKSDKDLAKKMVRLRRKARAVIPDEAIKIKNMIGDLFSGDQTVFNDLFKMTQSV